jgi:hypothetical protein
MSFLRELARIARGETLANDRRKQPDLGVSKGAQQATVSIHNLS